MQRWVIGYLHWTLPLSLACEQQLPPDWSDDDPGHTGDVDERTSYLPLVDGTTWTFVRQLPSGQWTDPRTSTLRASSMPSGPRPAYVQVEAWDGGHREEFLERRGTAVVQLARTDYAVGAPFESVIFGEPGLVWMDDRWSASEGPVLEVRYQHDVYAGTGELVQREWREFHFEVIDTFEPVTVPAGTFGCVHVRRTRYSSHHPRENIDFWFARGVGLVQSFDSDEGERDVLTSVHVPGGEHEP